MNRITKSPLWPIFLTVFLDMLGIGLIIPIMPLLLSNPSNPFYLLPASMSVSQGYLLLGLIMAMYPLFQFFASPILGQLSDKYGRRKILIISLIGTVIGYFLFALGIILHNIPLLFISRALDGITGGNISAAQAAVSDISDKSNRTRNFGIIGSAFGIGFILGPFLGGLLSSSHLVSWFNASTPFFGAGILAFLNIIFLYFFFPETNINLRAIKIRWFNSLFDIAHALSKNTLSRFFWSILFVTAGFTFFQTFAGVFFIQRFNFNQLTIGNYFALIGIFSILAQLLLVPFVAKKLSERTAITVSQIGMAINLFLYLLMSTRWQLYLSVPFFAAFNSIFNANAGSYLAHQTDASKQGEAMGLKSSVQALAQTVPPFVAGFLAAKFSAQAPILVGVICVVVSIFVFGSQKK